jgi:hypothetical protein
MRTVDFLLQLHGPTDHSNFSSFGFQLIPAWVKESQKTTDDMDKKESGR